MTAHPGQREADPDGEASARERPGLTGPAVQCRALADADQPPSPGGLVLPGLAHAFNHQHRLLAGEPGHASEGECQACPAEILGNGSLPDMLRLAARLGADVTPT